MSTWLIAEREIRTYVATASFWAALAIAPLIAGAALYLTGGRPQPVAVQIVTDDAALEGAARTALEEAARLEHRTFVFPRDGSSVSLASTGNGEVVARFANGFPLSAEGRVLFINTLERDLLRHAAPPTPASEAPVSVSTYNPAALSGFALMMMLWLVLTGSLGMLLQSIVRERSNRALETLLAAATPADIMLGKLLGVGAISFGLLAGWIGSVAAISFVSSGSQGLASVVLSQIAEPIVLVRAFVLFALGYLFYGSVTIALGAIARDVAAAQNLSRPMFVVLLAAFFVSLFGAFSGAPYWLVFVPPFTPFLLLLKGFAALPAATQAAALALLAAAAALAARMAIASISIMPADPLAAILSFRTSPTGGNRKITSP